MEHQAKRESRLDGDRRIDRLAATSSGRRRMPRRDGVRGEPHGEASPPDQSRIIVRPVRDPVSGLQNLVTAALIELVRQAWVCAATDVGWTVYSMAEAFTSPSVQAGTD